MEILRRHRLLRHSLTSIRQRTSLAPVFFRKGQISAWCLSACLLFCLLQLSLLLPQNIIAAQAHSREYEIKAAYLFNFLKFVNWPQDSFNSPDSPFVICTLGKNPFGEHLDTLSQKRVQGRGIVIVNHEELKPDEIIDCHILFISRERPNSVPDIIKRFHGRPVLTVSDIDEFSRQGGIIGMVQLKNNIRFHINQQALQDSGLKMSSQLLKLARKLI